ncbi:MAG: mRNA splicing protein [Watsoniomyces obsoletus]|nr:MAG: mRNA splicing protein [Watsoniomyces obsoletus]
MPSQRRWAPSAAALLLLASLALGQDNEMSDKTRMFPELANIKTLTRNPRLGGQSFSDRCCRMAVDETLTVINGTVVQTGLYIDKDINANMLRRGQFPCGAIYDGHDEGAPEVRVPYSWCKGKCPGWELSESTRFSQWVVPLAGFIIPSVVFCLTVPRRVKLSVSDKLFDVNLNRISQLPVVPFLAVAAGIWVALDTIIWVAIAFAFAGPMLLSGFYEGSLDQRILAYVREKIDNDRVRVDVRAQILFLLLVGNLDPDPAYHDVADMVAQLKKEPRTEEVQLAIDNIKVRLRSMMASQHGFGSMTGAPVVFYTAAFIYAVLDVQNRLGDRDTSHALAFGIWWMTIPHLSIVGACLLAGNNPTILESVVGRGNHNLADHYPRWYHHQEDGERRTGRISRLIPTRLLRFIPRRAPVFQSVYRPVAMWNRGKRKKQWINQLCRDHYPHLEDLQRRCEMRKVDWASVAGGAIFLALIPSLMAFIQSYYTPLIGVGCRAGTHLFYSVFQLLLTSLWLWDLARFERRDAVVPREADQIKRITGWHVLIGLCALPAAFIAIGGTMMQIMGVYRNCICQLNMGDWIGKKTWMIMSGNNAIHIRFARNTWVPIGGSATAFLAVVAYIGWWYQRHLRFQFRELVDQVDQRREEVEMVNQQGVAGHLNRNGNVVGGGHDQRAPQLTTVIGNQNGTKGPMIAPPSGV